MIRRLIAAVLAFSLVVLSPGLPCYQALGATFAGDAASVSAGPRATPGAAAEVQSIPALPQALPTAAVAGPAAAAAPAAAASAAIGAPAVSAAQAAPASADAASVESAASLSFAPSASRVARVGAMQRVARQLSSLFSVKKAAMAAAIGVAVAAGPVAAGAAAPQASVQLSAAPVAQPAVVDSLGAAAKAEKKTLAIGDSLTVTLTLENKGDAEQKVEGLRAVLEKASPASVAIRAVSQDSLVIPAGEKATVTVEIQLLHIPTGDKDVVQVPAYRVEAGQVSFTMPALEIAFKPVLPMPNWKDGDFNPVKQPLVKDGWQAGWLVALPFFGLLGYLYRRARRQAPVRTPAVDGPAPARSVAEAALKRLDEIRASGDAKEFYAGFGELLGRAFAERLALRDDKGLTFAQVGVIAEGSGLVDTQRVAELISALRRADRVAIGGAAGQAALMQADLDLARLVVDTLFPVAAPAPASASRSVTLNGFAPLALIPALDGLHWGQPYAAVLLGALVFVGYRVWRDSRRQTGALTMPSTTGLPSVGFLSHLKRWTIGAALASAIAVGSIAAAEPLLSSARQVMVVMVTKIVDVLDRSGSMGETMANSNKSKMQAAIEGEKLFLADQAKGANNQIGETVFDTHASILQPMTSDLKVDEAALAQIQAGGGTNIEIAIKVTINEFLKRNIVELDETKHPEAAELKRIMRAKGLTAALHYVQQLPQSNPLWTLVVRPDQAKVIRFATDGDSPGDLLGAARIAKYYGIKIYTIGLPASDLKEDVLQQIAGITGGTYARADDPQALAQIYLKISQEIKTPTPVQQVTEKSYRPWLAGLAFWLTVLGLGLAHLPLMRRLSLKVVGVAGALLITAAPASIMVLAPTSAQAQTLPAQPSLTPQPRSLEPFSTIPELREGRRLYAQGQPLDAMKSFLKALELHPQMPEIYADIGTSFLALGDVERAERFLKKGLEMAKQQKRDDLRGWIYYQLGWSALLDGDLEGADLMLRQALRAAPGDLELKQNAERVQRMIEEQKKQQQDQKNQKNKKNQKQQKQQKQKSQDQQQRAQQRRDGQKQDGQQQGQQNGQQQGQQDGQQDGQQQGQQKGQPGQQKGQQQPGTEDGDKQGEAPTPGDVLKQLEDAQRENGGAPAADPDTFGKMWSIALPFGLGAVGLSGLVPGTGSSAQAAEVVSHAAAAAASTAFGWGDPTALLWTAAAVVTLPLMMAFHYWQVFRRAKAQAPEAAGDSIGQSPMARRAFLKGALGVTAAALLGAGAADPWIGTKEVATNFGGGHDVIVMPDISNSVVFADDGRFDRMVGSLDALIGGLEKSNHLDRFAVVPMADNAGDGMLSSSYDAAREQLYDLREQSFRFQGGTNIAKAIRKAITVFETAPDLGSRPRVLLLPTDGGDVIPSATGDDEAKELYAAIKDATAKGIRIYTIGIGSASAKMIVPDEVREKSPNMPKYIQDGHGQDVVVSMNQGALESIAYLGNGRPFMAVSGKGMDTVLQEIAKDTRARDGAKQPIEVVSVKDSVGGWFIVPGVAALAASLYFRGKQALEDAERSKSKATLNSFALPAVLPFISPYLPVSIGAQLVLGVATTLLLGYWLADRISGYRFSRRLLDLWLVSTGTLRRDVARDASAVLLASDGREIDAKRLDAFLAQWRQAGRGFSRSAARERQRGLLASVNAKDDLWREKLVAAYLYEDSADMRAEISAALSNVDQRSTTAARDTVRAVLAQAQSVGWLSSDPMAQRLAALFKREDLADPQVRAYIERLANSDSFVAREAAYGVLESRPAKTPRTLKQRLGRLPAAAGIGALLLGSVAWNGAGIQNIAKMDAQRDAVRQTVSQDFFGADAYLLTQPYTDKRIENDVLPLLRRWETLTSADTPLVEQAIDTLLSSTDNKANQLLMFLYRQHLIFQLNGAIQQKLIRTLVERDDGDMTAALLADLEKHPKSQAAQQRLAFAVSVMTQLKNPHSFATMIRLIGSENDGVRDLALRAVLKVIRDPKNQDQSLAMLKMSLENYGKDPNIRIVHVPLLLEALAAKKEITAKDIELVRPLLQAAVTMDMPTGALSADQTAAFLQYQQQAFGTLASMLDKMTALRDRPDARAMIVGLIGGAASKTLQMGESASADSTRYEKILGLHGLRTITLNADGLFVDGRFVMPPNATFDTTEGYLDRYYADQLADAAKLFAAEAANQAGSDQFDARQPSISSYFGEAGKVLDVLSKLAAEVGADKAPHSDPLGPYAERTITTAVKGLNGPFYGQSWNNWLKLQLGVADLPDKMTREQLALLLPLMEKVLESGKLEETSRINANHVPLAQDERDSLASVLVSMRAILQAGDGVAGLSLIGADIIEKLGASFPSQTWREFITGSAVYSVNFPKAYTAAQFDAVIARMEKVLADGKLDVPSATRKELAPDEKAALEAALVKLRGLRAEIDKRAAAAAPSSAPSLPGGATLHSFALPALAALWMSAGESKLALAAFAATTLAAVIAFFSLGFHKPLKARGHAAASVQSIEEREHLLELDGHQVANSVLYGSLTSRFKGLDGMEYAESTPPAPGEAAGRVDYAATARTGRTHYKVFEQERDAPVMLIVDLSGSANAGSGAVSRRRAIEDAAGLFAFAAADGGSQRAVRSVGLMIVTDRVEAYIEPQVGKDQARRIFQELASFQPRHTGTNLKAGFDRYLAQMPPRSIVVPISDFVNASASAESLAAVTGAGHALLPIVVRDRLDGNGLAGLGAMKVRDAETGAITWAGDGQASEAARRDTLALTRAFERAGVRPIRLNTDGKHLDDLIRQAQQLGS